MRRHGHLVDDFLTHQDRNLEEGIDVSIARMRLQSHPFRHCYDKTHFLNASMDNREITMASEAGPEVHVPPEVFCSFPAMLT